MNSKFTVTDMGEFSPIDFGTPCVLREASPANSAGSSPAPATTGGASRASSSTNARKTAASTANKTMANNGAEEFKVFIQPTILGRRVDTATRRIFPGTERLPVEPHSFSLTMELVTPALLVREERQREKATRLEQQGKERRGNSNLNGVEKRRQQNTTTQQQQPVAKAPETALVRLSSGKIVRVPMDILRKHQQLKARAALASAASNDARLSQVLQRISPAANGNPTPQPSVNSLSLLNGRLPPPPPPRATGTLPQHQTQRLVKILAHPGPPKPPYANGIVKNQQQQSRLSESLSAIAPRSDLMVSIGSPVKVGFLQTAPMTVSSPMSPSPTTPAQFNGQRLSVALNMALQQQQQQHQSASPSKMVTPMYVITPRTMQLIQNGQGMMTNALSKVQLAPIFARKAVSSAVPSTSVPGFPTIVLQQTMTSGGSPQRVLGVAGGGGEIKLLPHPRPAVAAVVGSAGDHQQVLLPTEPVPSPVDRSDQMETQ